jgi:hypothetical protein
VEGDPVNRIDPEGLLSEDPCFGQPGCQYEASADSLGTGPNHIDWGGGLSRYEAAILSFFVGSAARSFSISTTITFADGTRYTSINEGQFSAVASYLWDVLGNITGVLSNSGYTFSGNVTFAGAGATGFLYGNVASGTSCLGYTVGPSLSPASAGFNFGMLLGDDASKIDDIVSGLGTAISAEAVAVGWQAITSISGATASGPTLGINATPTISIQVGSTTCTKAP